MATKSSTPRRFEFVDGGSDKFWEIAVPGPEVRVRFGRNGTHGQSSVTSLADARAAQKHADKLIRSKLGKGYCETV
jgi:predicted DNA-binding WGR domain protein